MESLLYKPASYLQPLSPAQLFSRDLPLEVELGCGDGTFLISYASLKPEINFIGVERLLGRIRKVDRKGGRAGLGNLKLVRLEASYFVEFLLPPRSTQAIHIYFPDPWPKRRHWKNRLINEGFLRSCAKALRPEGFVHVRTDNQPYFQHMVEAFTTVALFKAVQPPAELLSVRTDFEKEFHSRGLPTLAASYCLMS